MVLYHETVAARLGLNATENKVLGLIGREPGVSPTRLAEETRLSHAAITKITQRLVQLGYVARERDATDGRRVSLTSTARHREAMSGLMTPLLDGMAKVTGELTEAELGTVARWLSGTIAALRDATTALAEADPDDALDGAGD